MPSLPAVRASTSKPSATPAAVTMPFAALTVDTRGRRYSPPKPSRVTTSLDHVWLSESGNWYQGHWYSPTAAVTPPLANSPSVGKMKAAWKEDVRLSSVATSQDEPRSSATMVFTVKGS